MEQSSQSQVGHGPWQLEAKSLHGQGKEVSSYAKEKERKEKKKKKKSQEQRKWSAFSELKEILEKCQK